ncbi:MAG: tripartite tricarboxylate transporter substrate binding protein [Hyphomicrobiales bacterium]|nr:tripartite tricarboxylate transporter substrate binding protein [Hyphomicrobiales bacterium]
MWVLPGSRLVAVATVLSVLLPGLIVALGSSAQAQTRTIKVVAPVPPGGTTDILARLLADLIGHRRSLGVIVENRPGAGTVIGSEMVARAAPDGNTVLINTTGILITPYLQKAGYDPLTSFEPVCQLVSSPTVFLVNSASPYRTLDDLISAARSKPGEVSLGSIGPASPYQLGLETLKRAAKVDITYVPFAGSAPAMNALLGQHVTAVFAGYANAAELIKAGKVRALAVASRARIEPLPDVPTVAETGYKDFEVDNWFGLFAPAKTPSDVVAQLADWFTTAVKAEEIRPKLATHGLFPVGLCGADFAALLRKQYADYGNVIREANIKGE